jgi:glycosyltransferase involved in cell wall biosynthesis
MGMSSYHPAVVGFGIIERYLYRNADKIVTLLPNAAEYMVPRGARPKDITWIPNGVDMELMPFPDIPTPNNAFTVMYAGSHGLSDALDTVLDAAAILNKKAPDRFCFRFVGDGPNKCELQRRVVKENIANVVFENPVPRGEVFSILQDADAFIITAKKTDLYRYGISPNKLHEYMAAARPTIFAGNSHNNPIAEAAAGTTVAPEDPRAIVAAIEALEAMPTDERWNMGLRARKYTEEQHDFAVLASRLERVLQSALVSPEETQDLTINIDADRPAALEVKSAHPQ